jgi:hypothetical protein
VGLFFRVDAPTVRVWHATSRLLGLIIALTLTAGGALWLLVQIIIPERASRNLVVAAGIVVAMGAHWLWTDYVRGKPRQEG